MLTDEKLKAIEDRCEAATPGPWGTYPTPKKINPGAKLGVGQIGSDEAVCEDYWGLKEDAEFIVAARADIPALLAEVKRLRRLIHAPELLDFSKAVVLEAAHQRARWGADHDAGKAPADWFWLLGYLAGKALSAASAGDIQKALHHTISGAAALANWHAALLGKTNMRPGIEPPAEATP